LDSFYGEYNGKLKRACESLKNFLVNVFKTYMVDGKMKPSHP